MQESDLKRALGSLPDRIKPERDLWPQINQRLDPLSGVAHPVQKRSYWRLPAIAAMVLLTLITGGLIGRGVGPTPSADVSHRLLESALNGSLLGVEREYQAVFQELLPLDYSSMRPFGTNADFLSASWGELLRTETLLLVARKEYPENAFLTKKLLELRSRQLRFLKQMVMLEQNDWRTT